VRSYPAKVDNEQQDHWADTQLKPAIEAARKGKVHLLFFGCSSFYALTFYLLIMVCLQVIYQGRQRQKPHQCAGCC
jgi:hypothetical protein